MSAGVLAALLVQLFAGAVNGWPHNVLRIISQLKRDCKALLVTRLTHVSSTVSSTDFQ